MKSHRYYILSLIVVVLAAISFDIDSSKLMDNTLETKIEASLEEKKSEAKSDENLIVNVSELYLKETKAFAGFDFSTPIVDRLNLNSIFKPPIFS
jgi:hypothetical protein